MLDSAEYKLLIALTHPFSNQDNSAVLEALVDKAFDWGCFYRITEWHRLIPQVYRGLVEHKQAIPEQTFLRLREASMTCQRRSLQQSGWVVKLAILFDKQQIRFIVLKGVVLSQLLYDDSGRREAKDLDILIDQADLAIVEQLLVEECGFIRTNPSIDASSDEISYLNRYKKDRVYVNSNDHTMIELHWRFVNEKPILPLSFSEIHRQSSIVLFHHQAIPMLGDNHLWLYQSLHGTYSGWYRFHWLTDIAEMLVQNPVDWDILLELAEKHHCKRCLVEAVELAGQVYQLPIPDAIHVQLQSSWRQQMSLSFARRLLVKAGFLSPFLTVCRVLLWFPKRYYFYYFKYYCLYFLYKVAHCSDANPSNGRGYTAHEMLNALIQPVALRIFRLF